MSGRRSQRLALPVRRLLSLLVAVPILGSCGGEASPDDMAMSHHDHGAEPLPAPAGEMSGHSLFHLGSEWYDQAGDSRTLASLGGKVQVVTMVYTHCGFACPRIIGDMKRIESELEEEVSAGRVGFVLVSIDPERDTPERLARFAEDVRLEPDRWTLLSSEEGNILELAAVLGVRYVRESPSDFGHTNLIAVLRPTGEVAFRQLGVGDGVEETIETIRGLLSPSSD